MNSGSDSAPLGGCLPCRQDPEADAALRCLEVGEALFGRPFLVYVNRRTGSELPADILGVLSWTPGFKVSAVRLHAFQTSTSALCLGPQARTVVLFSYLQLAVVLFRMLAVLPMSLDRPCCGCRACQGLPF